MLDTQLALNECVLNEWINIGGLAPTAVFATTSPNIPDFHFLSCTVRSLDHMVSEGPVSSPVFGNSIWIHCAVVWIITCMPTMLLTHLCTPYDLSHPLCRQFWSLCFHRNHFKATPFHLYYVWNHCQYVYANIWIGAKQLCLLFLMIKCPISHCCSQEHNYKCAVTKHIFRKVHQLLLQITRALSTHG